MANFEAVALTPEIATKFNSPAPETSSAILDHEQKVAVPFPASLETIEDHLRAIEAHGHTVADALDGCFTLPGLYEAVMADREASNG